MRPSALELSNILAICAYLRSQKSRYPDLVVSICNVMFKNSFPRQEEFVRFWSGRGILSGFRRSITIHSSSATCIFLRVSAWIARSAYFCCPLDTCPRVVQLRPINITATWIGSPTSRTQLQRKRCNISRDFTPTLRVRWVNYAGSAIGGYCSNGTRMATHRISALCPCPRNRNRETRNWLSGRALSI
jgi:hypothetical protein